MGLMIFSIFGLIFKTSAMLVMPSSILSTSSKWYIYIYMPTEEDGSLTPSSQGLLFPLPKNELESVGMYEDGDIFFGIVVNSYVRM